MAQTCIHGFDRIGLLFVHSHFVGCAIVECVIGWKGIRVVLFGLWCSFQAGLQRFRGSLLEHPNSMSNGALDPRWLGCRFRFFLADKGEQFIQFCFFYLLWQRCLRQLGGVGADPVGDALWIDFRHSSNGSITTAFHIHADG